VLAALVDEVLDRMSICRAGGVRSIWDLPDPVRPAPVVVVVDEIAELFLHADRAGKDEAARCVTALVRLAQLGAAAGIHLWVAGQRFGSDLGPGATLLRAQLAGRICHRVTDIETAQMTLAGLGTPAVEAAISIPPDLPGVAVVGDDSGTWYRARSQPVRLHDAVTITHRCAHLTPALTEQVPTLAHLTHLGRYPGSAGSSGSSWSSGSTGRGRRDTDEPGPSDPSSPSSWEGR
jgi:DNA segregation ATPase FtsK/SpoIIIE, S-DNA-T family